MAAMVAGKETRKETTGLKKKDDKKHSVTDIKTADAVEFKMKNNTRIISSFNPKTSRKKPGYHLITFKSPKVGLIQGQSKMPGKRSRAL